MRQWRNGSRNGLKIRWELKSRVGSSPTCRIEKIIPENKNFGFQTVILHGKNMQYMWRK